MSWFTKLKKKISWRNLERGVKRTRKKLFGDKAFYRLARKTLKDSLIDLVSKHAGISEESLELYWDKAQKLVYLVSLSHNKTPDQKRDFVKEQLLEFGVEQGLKLLGGSDLNLLIEQVYAQVWRFDF